MADFGALLDQYADQYGVPRPLAHALMGQESGGDPGAVSSAGARGLMQVMPATAAGYGVSPQQLHDPETNIRTGLHYFSDMLRHTGGDVPGALISYNAGPGWYDKLHSGQIAFSALPHETQSYVPSVLARAGRPSQIPQDAFAPLPAAHPAQASFRFGASQDAVGNASPLVPASAFAALTPTAYSSPPAPVVVPQSRGISYGEDTTAHTGGGITGAVYDPTGDGAGSSFGRFGYGSRSPYDAADAIARTFADLLRG